MSNHPLPYVIQLMINEAKLLGRLAPKRSGHEVPGDPARDPPGVSIEWRIRRVIKELRDLADTLEKFL